MADLPPMPKPEDFGISDEDWGNARSGMNDSSVIRAKEKIAAYNRAIDAWKEVAIAISSRADKQIDINRG